MSKGKKRPGASPPAPDEMARLFDRLPPNSVEAEMSLLGAMILAGGNTLWIIGDVQDIIRGPGDFMLPKHQAIYADLISLYDETASMDTVQLQAKMKKSGMLEAVGGIDYLVELAESVPTCINAPHFAKIVRDTALLRDLINCCGVTMRECYESPEGAEAIMERAEQAMFAVTSSNESENDGPNKIGAAMQAQFEKMERLSGEGETITGIRTGYYQLDALLTGLQPGEMIVLAARPSIGKSALALNIAEYVAVTNGEAVGFFAMEMSKEELSLRMLATRAGVDLMRMKRNLINQIELERLGKAAAEVGGSPLLVDDRAGVSITALRSRARRMKQEHDIKLVVIDYLQLMSGHGADNRQEEVSHISRGIKALARELHVPIIALSQLNRKSQDRDDKRPRLSELRESGSIEQDADVVMLLHREAQYHVHDYDEWASEHPELVGHAEVIVEKQRNGPTGNVALHWDAKGFRFHNAANPMARHMATTEYRAPYADRD